VPWPGPGERGDILVLVGADQLADCEERNCGLQVSIPGSPVGP